MITRMEYFKEAIDMARCRNDHPHEVLQGSNRYGPRCRQAEDYPEELSKIIATVVMEHPIPEMWQATVADDVLEEVHTEVEMFPNEEENALAQWRRDFTEDQRNAIVRTHTNMGHPMPSTLAKMLHEAGADDNLIKCAMKYPCPVCLRQQRPRMRRPTSVPRTRQFNDTLLVGVNYWDCNGEQVLMYHMIDEATRFHVAHVLANQSAPALYEAIMASWIKWAGPPRFILVDPHRSQNAKYVVEKLGQEGTTVLAGAAEASWTRGLVERHGAYLRSMIEKMRADGLPEDVPIRAVVDKAAAAKNMMSRIRGYSPAQWVLATQPHIP